MNLATPHEKWQVKTYIIVIRDKVRSESFHSEIVTSDGTECHGRPMLINALT
jgi:uncharacterized protein (UPF0248 family)